MAAVALIVLKGEDFNTKSERFRDGRENPCCKKADFEDPKLVLMDEAMEATQGKAAFDVKLSLLAWERVWKGAVKTEENNAIEEMKFAPQHTLETRIQFQ